MKIKIISTDKEKYKNLIGKEFEVTHFQIEDSESENTYISIPANQCKIIQNGGQKMCNDEFPTNCSKCGKELILNKILSYEQQDINDYEIIDPEKALCDDCYWEDEE